MYNLAVCYENGEGVEQNYQKAAELYKKLVDLGDSRGIFFNKEFNFFAYFF